ncbi:uncharacterized protein V1518DRAFT_417299 [Limtongia smithiae]|uniref:uncharacterized protein n=1 Tax=Limtongia smithiae TaxID=1125753 RepID=UPI0034CD3E79
MPSEETSLELFEKSVLRRYATPGLVPLAQANALVLLLTEFLTDPVDDVFLKFSARFLTPIDYDEVIAERNVSHRCGYPTCAEIPTTTPRGSTKAMFRITYPLPPSCTTSPSPSSYLARFCCKSHFQASVIYRAQLSADAVWTRMDITWLHYGEGEWERSVKLLNELVAEAPGQAKKDVVADNVVRSAMAALTIQDQPPVNVPIASAVDATPTADDIDLDNELDDTDRNKTAIKLLQHHKELGLEDAMSELRVFERTTAAAKLRTFRTQQETVDGYVPGSAATIKLPRGYVEWQARRELEQEGE